jgi:alpha-L-fucosidase
LLVDIVSKNGNLLLNIGPKYNGAISDIQLDRLHKLGAWLDTNGEGIFGSRPWTRPSATAPDGTDVRFTRKGDSVYAFFLARPRGETLTLPSMRAAEGTTARILGTSLAVSISQRGKDLVLASKGPLPAGYAITARITPPPSPIA